uniref:Bac_surface_Ag domain-containing protein n=1 Tax=Macrostomum lignano TaxID=282301 RepID=A0A1I8JL56_9PLAT
MLLQWSRQKAIHKRVEEQFKSNNNMPTAKLNPDPEMHAFVERVHVKGLRRTRDQLVHSQVRRLLSDRVATWGQLVLEIQAAKRRLQALGVFTRVDVTIDTAKSPVAERAGLANAAYEVVFEVQECKQMQYGVRTMAGMDGTVSLVLNGNLRNLTGNAERLIFDYQIGTRDSKSHFLTLARALAMYPFAKASAGLESHSSCFASFSLPLGPTEQLLRAELSWRQLLASQDGRAPLAVRELCGHSIKCGLKHVLEADSRDSATVPMSGGLMMRLTSELAGFGGDVRHLRLGAKLSRSLPLAPLFPAASIHLTAACGHAVPMNGGGIPLADRFTIGGLSSGLRGFDINCVGPSVPRAALSAGEEQQQQAAPEVPSRCYLGGESFFTAGAHLYCPLPLVTRRGNFFDLFRLHAFANAGCLVSNAGGAPVGDWRLPRFPRDEVRLSYGIGILLAVGGLARFELNYTVPQAACAGDKLAPGVGLGIHTATTSSLAKFGPRQRIERLIICHCLSPLVTRRGNFFDLFRLHAFANAGCLVSNAGGAPVGDWRLPRFPRDEVRLSYGIGILLAVGGLARFELNYTVPQAACAGGDKLAPAL